MAGKPHVPDMHMGVLVLLAHECMLSRWGKRRSQCSWHARRLNRRVSGVTRQAAGRSAVRVAGREADE